LKKRRKDKNDMSIYDPLEKHLNTARITLTFDEIERILGFELPKSAHIHDAWWDNGTHNHPQRNAWINAGWRVVDYKFGEYATFEKISE
jgi:hypothetical protein